MKISKKTLLIMGGIFSVSSLGLMFVSAAERNLSKDLNNAVQHINEVKFVLTGKNGAEATLGFLDGNLVEIEAGSGFFISEDNQASFGLMGGEYSSVLGGYRNRKGGTYDVVLGGSGNSVRGSYNSILGGEGNSITGGSYNTIIGGIENKINSKSSLYSVILGGISNMIGSGKSSVVMGTHSSVNGSHSVALGSGSKVEANNSFLWTDGRESANLDSDNVFVVMAQSGVVINVDKAHSFAKLTLGGPMILFVGRTGENITCEGGVGGGILKVVESENNQMCMCSCDGNGWSSMFGKGRCRSVCDVNLEPKCGETVTKVAKNDRGRVYAAYSGKCERGVVVEGTGAYLVTKDNKVHWSCQSEDGLVVGCSGSVEGGYLTVNSCRGTEPSGPGVITGSSTYLGNNDMYWQGNDNISGTPLACQWKCGTGYKIDYQNGLVNGKPTRCKVEVVEKDCTGTPPTNADWVNNKFTQTWNGSEWTPGNVEISYWDGNNTKPCSYKCNTGYDWNGTSCEAKIYQCTGQVPSNAVLVPGSTAGLTAYVENKLYPSRTEAGNNKCAYVCKVAEKFVYDPDYGKCTKINTFCSETTPYKCEYSATVTNTGGNDNEYTWDCEVEGEKVESCSLPKTSVCNLSNKSNLRSNQERCTVGELDGTPEYKLNPVGDPYREYKCKLGSDIVDCSKGTNVVHFYGPEWRGGILKDNIDFTAYFPNYLYGIKYKWNSCGRLGGVEKRMGMDINGGNNNGGGQPTESQFPGPLQFNGWLPSRHSSGQPIFEYESGSKIYSITGAYSEKGNYLVVPYSGANISTKDIAIVTINNCPGNEDNVCNYVNGNCKSGRRFRTGSTEENGKTWVCEKNGMIHNCSLKWECKGTCKNNNENCVGMYTSSPRDNKYNCEAAGVYRLKPYGGSTIFVRPCRYSPTGNLGSEYYNILGCNSIDTYDSDCRNRQNSEHCEYAQCFKWNPEGRVCNVGYGYSGNITEITQHTGNEAYMWCSNGAIPTPPLGRCEYTCRGAVPYGAVPAKAGNTGDLIEDTEIKLYASKSAAGNKKCAYVCNAANKFVYDPDYGKCIKINSFCSETPNECLYGATSDGHNVSGTGLHTWNCRVDGQFVERCTKNSIEPGSCTGCPGKIVSNGKNCISYKSSYSCECQDLKVISHCVNGEWDEAPASFSSCTAYTGQDQICVGYRREYSDPAFRHNDPDYYSNYECTRQDQPVGGDCSVLCAETNNHECVKDNNISPYDTININTNCCVCGYANVCNYDFKLPNKPVDSVYGKWGRDESYRIDLWSQHPSWPHNWDLFNG